MLDQHDQPEKDARPHDRLTKRQEDLFFAYGPRRTFERQTDGLGKVGVGHGHIMG